MFEACLNIGLFQLLAHIEGSAAGTAEAFSADISALFVFILIQPLLGADGQMAALQRYFNLILPEARQIYVHFIAVLLLPHIRLHDTGRILSEHRVLSSVQLFIQFLLKSVVKREIHPIIK